jgi:ABC-2 type transport system permease protein
MSNILAIAHKEIRSYFASPIAYIVIGFFALVYGYLYVVMLQYFVRASMQGGRMGMGAPSMNINQDMLRPVVQNLTVVMLFLLPMITMRTYSEEKRSGTIELLLTSPLTDMQIILGKFLGAMSLYGAMLAITIPHMVPLFYYGRPEWKPIISSYLGLLLMGGCFISLGLFISSLTRNQIVAGMITFSVFLLLWVINWVSTFVGPTAQTILGYLSITEHFDDFAKGIIDTKHVVYYLSFIAMGLFLTMKSVDSERWRG